MPTLARIDPVPAVRGATDPVGLAWLVTGRWTTILAAAGAIVAGERAAENQLSWEAAATALSALVVSNLWLWWRVRNGRPTSTTVGGLLVCVDVAVLSWLLLECGGVLNPASVFYLVQIVLAALVLGRTWTWIVAGLSVAGYGALFLTPTDALRAAQGMHPEIALHMRGMWMAFALAGLIIAVLVTRLTMAVERSDRALEALRDRGARATRLAGLTAAVAGAAHELGTPLATIAVAARELERATGQPGGDSGIARDARLIRLEIDRCRSILDQMAGRIAEPMGEPPRTGTAEDVVAATLDRLGAADRARIHRAAGAEIPVMWPAGIVAQALGNLVKNALQSSNDGGVDIDTALLSGDRVRIRVRDRGHGMSPDVLARAGEPFFTTKPAGSGTGLGVFVARSAVEQLGGNFTLSSTLGEGTTAEIVLPRDVTSRPEGAA